jgi:hypothetical protein
LAKWYSGHGFAWAANAARSFFSVRAVIADSAIAAWLAAIKPVSSNCTAPIAGTNRVRRAGSIIATGSGNTVSAGRERA